MAEVPTEFLLYQAEDGQTRIDLRVQDETVWLTKASSSSYFRRQSKISACSSETYGRRRAFEGGNSQGLLDSSKRRHSYRFAYGKGLPTTMEGESALGNCTARDIF